LSALSACLPLDVHSLCPAKPIVRPLVTIAQKLEHSNVWRIDLLAVSGGHWRCQDVAVLDGWVVVYRYFCSAAVVLTMVPLSRWPTAREIPCNAVEAIRNMKWEASLAIRVACASRDLRRGLQWQRRISKREQVCGEEGEGNGEAVLGLPCFSARPTRACLRACPIWSLRTLERTKPNLIRTVRA
jgi:hypothetical protein